MRLLVTGASGLLGLNLSLLAQDLGYEVVGFVHSHPLQGVPFDVRVVDLLDSPSALKAVKESRPDGIIHCAALADLGKAEKSPSLAQALNVDVPGMIAETAFDWNIPLIHISTDAVFDGRMGGYIETDPPNPLSVYARTKLAGERIVQERNPDALIARVVFYGWSLSGKRSLSEFFYNHLKDGQPVKGFIDTLFSPLYVEDLGEILLRMMRKKLKGLYHVVSPECLSKYDFGIRIAERFGFDPGLIEPVKMREIQREAPRSLNLTLEPNKLQTDLGIRLPSIEEGIDRFYKRWEQGYHLKLQAFSK
jgi:dTDP-4-dehydrorhamnose reductase